MTIIECLLLLFGFGYFFLFAVIISRHPSWSYFRVHHDLVKSFYQTKYESTVLFAVFIYKRYIFLTFLFSSTSGDGRIRVNIIIGRESPTLFAGGAGQIVKALGELLLLFTAL